MKKMIILVGCFMLVLFLKTDAQQRESLPDYKNTSVHFASYVEQYESWLREKEKAAITPAEKKIQLSLKLF